MLPTLKRGGFLFEKTRIEGSDELLLDFEVWPLSEQPVE